MKASRWIAAAAVLLVVAVAATHAQEAAPAPVPADPEVPALVPEAKGHHAASTFGASKARAHSPSGTNSTHPAAGRRPHNQGHRNSTAGGSRRPGRNSTQGHHAAKPAPPKTHAASVAEPVEVPDDKVETWKSAVLMAWMKESGVYDLHNSSAHAADVPASVAKEQEHAAAALSKLDSAVGNTSATQLRNAVVLSWLKDTGALDLLDKLHKGAAPTTAVPELQRAAPAAPAAPAAAAAAPAKANTTSALEALKAAIILSWANDGGVSNVMKQAAALRSNLQGAVADASHAVDDSIRAASVALGSLAGGNDKVGRKVRGGDKGVRAASVPDRKIGDKKPVPMPQAPTDLLAGARKHVNDAMKKLKLPQLPRRVRAAGVTAPAPAAGKAGQSAPVREVPLRTIGAPVKAATIAASEPAAPAAATPALCSARPAEARQECYNAFALKLATKAGQPCVAAAPAEQQECINAFVGREQRRKGSIASCERAAPANAQACVNAWLESQMKAEAGLAAVEGPAATAGATLTAEAVPVAADAVPVA